MVTPKLSRDTGNSRVKRTRQRQHNTEDSNGLSSSGPHSYYMLLAVKILLVVIILLWLPPLVTSKRQRKRNALKTIQQRIYHNRMDCEMDCLQLSHEVWFPPEESMNCIFHCMSPSCFETIYQPILEPGEVDIQRYELFETCIQEEVREENRQQAAEKLKK
ncbi:protein of unknown function DUF4787 containing protein [Nitzschia inconspicua]|uniref:Uncharacterized protein n=1 Tax=Nitzschia inconspicua TaxID=303405 RepID=A0A9K3LZQ9_9STRA|nr:protein of unknown function DUF4787 containing protein [Nitzschia inconspicua]